MHPRRWLILFLVLLLVFVVWTGGAVPASEAPWLIRPREDVVRFLATRLYVDGTTRESIPGVALLDRLVSFDPATGTVLSTVSVEPLQFGTAWRQLGGALLRQGVRRVDGRREVVVERWGGGARRWCTAIGPWGYEGREIVRMRDPVAVAAGVIACHDGDGGLVAVAAEDGRVVWRLAREWALPSLTHFACPEFCQVGEGVVIVECLETRSSYIPLDAMRIDVLRAGTGERLCAPRESPTWMAALGLRNGCIGIWDIDGFHIVPVATERWLGWPPGTPGDRVLPELTYSWPSVVTVVGPPAKVLNLAPDGNLSCFVIDEGRRAWTRRVDSVVADARARVVGGVTDLGDAVFVSRCVDRARAAHETVQALIDLETGALRWSATVPGVAVGEAVRCDDAVMALTADVEKDAVTVTSFGMRDGAVRWTRTILVKAEAAGTKG